MRTSGVVIVLASCGTFTENDTLSSHSMSEPPPCGSDISGTLGMSSGRCCDLLSVIIIVPRTVYSLLIMVIAPRFGCLP